MRLWLKILIGLFAGTAVGLILGETGIYFKPIGTVFLNLINMIIVLLIFSSMAVGVNRIHDPEKLGRVGGKTLAVYFTTTFIAIFIGLTLANFSAVGTELHLTATQIALSTPPSIADILISIVPSNPVAALANGNILQVIVFSLFLGLAINFSGEKGRPLLTFLESLADVMYRLTSIVMEFSPIGVFAIMVWVTGTFGLSLFLPLMKFLGIYYAACLLQVLIVYFPLLKVGAGLPLKPFFRGTRDALILAFSTCSSAATLPVAMHCVQDNLGVSKNISSFVLPLGLTFNMNGTAIYQAMSAVFLAHAYGIELELSSYVTLILTSVLSAIGTAGVPGGGFIMLSAVLTSVGIPIEGLAILAGIDRLREMVTTTLNILGDSAVTVYIAQSEGELDEGIYRHSTLAEIA